MKLDKEMLVKQRFWIFLGLEVPLVLIATVVLLFGVRAAIAKREKEVVTKTKAVSDVKNVRNGNWLEEFQKIEKTIDAKLVGLWEEGWKVQQELMTWPGKLHPRFRSGQFAVKLKVRKEKVELEPPTDAEKAYLFRGKIMGFPTTALEPLVVEGPARSRTAKGGPGSGGNAAPPPKPKMVVERFFASPNMKVSVEGETEATVASFEKLQDLQRANKGMTVEVTFIKAKYFGDDFTLREKEDYSRDYKQQLRDLYALLLDAKGYDAFQRNPEKATVEPLVQVEGGWTAKNGKVDIKVPAMIRWVPSWEREKMADAETIWNAQEDLWIQRELIRVAKDANDLMGKLQGAGGTEERKDYHFASPIWRVDIQRVKNQLKATLTNISKQTQQLDLSFMVRVSEGERSFRAELRFPAVEGREVLAPGQATLVPLQDFSGLSPQGVFGVEQVLTLATAPVKRIQDMKLSEHSHRTYPKGLRFRAGSVAAKLEEEKAKEKEGGDGDNKQPAQGGSRGGSMQMGKGSLGADEKKLDPNKRYSDSTEQFRKMPVAMVFVVDQDAVPYVLTAFEKSKLRFQVTQVLMTRYTKPLKEARKGKKEAEPGPKEKPATAPMGVTNPMGGGPMGGSMRGPPRGIPPSTGGKYVGSMMGGSRGRSSSPQPTGLGGEGANIGGQIINQPRVDGQGEAGGGSLGGGEQVPVVELVVYGYATIYERYPRKQAAASVEEANPQVKH
jgi:hypothetical protein